MIYFYVKIESRMGKGKTFCFYMSTVQIFWKHWEKEKLFLTSKFSFSYSVFYCIGKLSTIFIYTKNCRLQTI